jgi:hypothetical protein
VKPASPAQIVSFLSNEMKDHDVLLTLDAVSPMWAKRLEESKLLPLLSIRRLQLYAELKHTSERVLEKHMAFPHIMYLIVNSVLILLGSLCFIYDLLIFKIRRSL